MKIFDTAAVTDFTLPGTYLGGPWDQSFYVCAIQNPTWKVRKVETTTFTTTDQITLPELLWARSNTAIDGNTAWVTLHVGWSLSRPDTDFACFDFTAGAITHRWRFPYNYNTAGNGYPMGVEIAKVVSGGSIYVLVVVGSGQMTIKNFSFTGSELSSVNVGTPNQFRWTTSQFWPWIFQNGAFWTWSYTDVGFGVPGAPYLVYKITTGGTLTTITTDFATPPSGFIRNAADDKILIGTHGTGNSVFGSWGTLDTLATTWTMMATGLDGTPPRYGIGGLGRIRLDLDTYNFVSFAGTGNGQLIPMRAHKTYGIQDVSMKWPNGIGAGGVILPYTSGKFIGISGTALSVVDWTDDSANTITPSTSWQETALTTISQVGPYIGAGTTLHNFYFSATKGDIITFTLDVTKDPTAECNINTNVRMYLSVHELWEEKLAESVPTAYTYSDKSLFFAAPATGDYLVRVSERNGITTPFSLYGGTFKLGYAKMVPSFTHDPDPQVPLSPVTFTDTSSGGPTVWHWDFGDGATSSSRNPTHTYATSDTYSVTLTLKG